MITEFNHEYVYIHETYVKLLRSRNAHLAYINLLPSKQYKDKLLTEEKIFVSQLPQVIYGFRYNCIYKTRLYG